MKIATWNVNSIRARTNRVTLWLEANVPDVLLLQETKVVDKSFPREAFEALGYHIELSGQPAYNGVAIASKLPIENIETGFPLKGDTEARGIAGTIAGIRIVNIYVPNGQQIGTAKFIYKQHWLDSLLTWLQQRYDPTEQIVVAGDFNIAPEDRDVHDPAIWHNSAISSNEVRHQLQALIDWGLTDSLRAVSDETGVFTWWDYQRAAFRFNKGLRIDLMLVTETLRERITSVVINRDDRKVQNGIEKPSDHIPVLLELRD